MCSSRCLRVTWLSVTFVLTWNLLFNEKKDLRVLLILLVLVLLLRWRRPKKGPRVDEKGWWSLPTTATKKPYIKGRIERGHSTDGMQVILGQIGVMRRFAVRGLGVVCVLLVQGDGQSATVIANSRALEGRSRNEADLWRVDQATRPRHDAGCPRWRRGAVRTVTRWTILERSAGQSVRTRPLGKQGG